MRSTVINDLPLVFTFLLIICMVEVRSLLYAARVVKSVKEKNETEANWLKPTLSTCRVCSGDHEDRWRRCDEAVQISFCRFLKIELDVTKPVGEVKVYGIKEKGLPEMPVFACECPAKPKSIYLTDDLDKASPNDVHVIIVENFSENSLRKSSRRLIRKVRNAFWRENKNNGRGRPTFNTMYESAINPVSLEKSAPNQRSENLKERVSRSGGSVRGARSECGVKDDCSLLGSRSMKQSSNRNVTNGTKNRESTGGDDTLNSDHQSIKSRSSVRDKSVSRGRKNENSPNELEGNEPPKKINIDISEPDPSELASAFEGPASVNNELYKDILQWNEKKSVPLGDGEDSKPDSSHRPSRRESLREKIVAEASGRNSRSGTIIRGRSRSGHQLSRAGSVQGGPVVGSLDQGVAESSGPGKQIPDCRPSGRDSVREQLPNPDISDESPEYTGAKYQQISDSKNIREKARKMATFDETTNNSGPQLSGSASMSTREKSVSVRQNPDPLVHSRSINRSTRNRSRLQSPDRQSNKSSTQSNEKRNESGSVRGKSVADTIESPSAGRQILDRQPSRKENVREHTLHPDISDESPEYTSPKYPQINDDQNIRRITRSMAALDDIVDDAERESNRSTSWRTREKTARESPNRLPYSRSVNRSVRNQSFHESPDRQSDRSTREILVRALERRSGSRSRSVEANDTEKRFQPDAIESTRRSVTYSDVRHASRGMRSRESSSEEDTKRLVGLDRHMTRRLPERTGAQDTSSNSSRRSLKSTASRGHVTVTD